MVILRGTYNNIQMSEHSDIDSEAREHESGFIKMLHQRDCDAAFGILAYCEQMNIFSKRLVDSLLAKLAELEKMLLP